MGIALIQINILERRSTATAIAQILMAKRGQKVHTNTLADDATTGPTIGIINPVFGSSIEGASGAHYKIVFKRRHTVHNSNNVCALNCNCEFEGSGVSANGLVDYEIRLFSKSGQPSIVIRASCGSDTAALKKIVQMGVTDYQSMEVWRDLERIYVGRDVPCSRPRIDGVFDIELR